MRVFVLALLGCCLASTFAGCARRAPLRQFEHTAFADHPLVGRIWDARTERWVGLSALEEAVRQSRFLLLGESHDNVDHHRLQAALLAQWREAHPDGRVAFEQLDEAQGRALAAHPLRSPADVRRYSRWDDTGWPDFALYAPLFEVALKNPGGPLAAHPTKDTLRAVMMGQEVALPKGLAWLPKPPEPLMAALREEIVAAHCGHTPGPMLEPMVEGQRLKDAWMAQAMTEAEAPVALIAGGGHVRRDRGVPYYLARHQVHDVLSVVMRPVAEGALTPADYETSAYDYVIFTPATSTVSACDRFREQLKRMREGQGSHDAKDE